MGKAIYRKLSGEERLKEYARSSFGFVGGSGLIPEHVPESNKDQNKKEDDSEERS